MYIPSTTHVTPLATLRRERLLPQPGYVLVDEGERIESGTVVAQAETVVKHYYYDVALRLGVPADEVSKYLRAQVGVAMAKGDTIAQRPTLLGLGSIAVKAPAKGTVVDIFNGKLLFAATGAEIQVRAGFPGVINSVNPDWGVMIETAGALVQAMWGSGKQEYGVLKMLVNDPAQPLATELLDATSKGAIVVAGKTDEKGLKACDSAKVRGLVLGSMPAALIKLARSLSFPIVLVEGFGKAAMSAMAWTLFADHNGREVFIDARPPDRWEGRRPEVIIPLPHPGGAVPLPADGQPVSQGKRVRILRAPHAGVVGTVSLLPPRMAELPSGVQAYVAHVDVPERGTIIVPLANVEIYE
jgi:hypothetical protein